MLSPQRVFDHRTRIDARVLLCTRSSRTARAAPFPPRSVRNATERWLLATTHRTTAHETTPRAAYPHDQEVRPEIGTRIRHGNHVVGPRIPLACCDSVPEEVCEDVVGCQVRLGGRPTSSTRRDRFTGVRVEPVSPIPVDDRLRLRGVEPMRDSAGISVPGRVAGTARYELAGAGPVASLVHQAPLPRSCYGACVPAVSQLVLIGAAVDAKTSPLQGRPRLLASGTACVGLLGVVM